MRINPEVRKALAEHRPVVALETTIISHGMPYPQNVRTALEVEETIRENGAVPATIGIIEGEPIIGMTPDEIEEFGKKKGIVKCSRRDLPIVYANRQWGATTVAGTMILASQAGIEFFVTGGIGGVQRGWNETLDISADMEELGRTDVTVICAGAKTILDIGATMEVLETKGVPVIGLGTSVMPDFFTRFSPFRVDYAATEPLDVARIVFQKRVNHLTGGVLVADPIPVANSMDPQRIEKAVSQAIKKMETQGIHGKDETPFLLKTIVELTGGDSLEANIALIKNNAKDGALIAKAYCKLALEGEKA